jgi:hypothetical protein
MAQPTARTGDSITIQFEAGRVNRRERLFISDEGVLMIDLKIDTDMTAFEYELKRFAHQYAEPNLIGAHVGEWLPREELISPFGL